MYRMIRLTGVALALVLFLAVSPSPTAACISPRPSMDDVAHARSIVVGRVIEHQAIGGATDRWELEVDQVLQGDVGRRFVVSGLRVNACGDDIGAEAGIRLILAVDFPFKSEPALDAYWSFESSGTLLGTSVNGFALDVDTVETVADALSDLPDTSTGAAAPAAEIPMWLIAALAVLALIISGRRFWLAAGRRPAR